MVTQGKLQTLCCSALKCAATGVLVVLAILYLAGPFSLTHQTVQNAVIDFTQDVQHYHKALPPANHIQDAYTDGRMFEISPDQRLESYRKYPKYDLWKEDIADIVGSWKRQSPASDVYDVHKYISKPDYLSDFHNPCYYDDQHVLRCLPRFMLIGIQKCGTTDLYDKLNMHPHMARAATKEPFWWNRRRMAHNQWSGYLQVFSSATQKIEQNVETRDGQPHHHIVTGEGSAGTIWDTHNWMSLPENEGFTEPVNLTANAIHAYLPTSRFVLIVREPTQRLYSDYNYFSGRLYKRTPEDFDQRVRYAITWLEQCFKTLSIRHCLYDPPARNLSDIKPKWYKGLHFTPVARLRLGLYSELLAEWNQVFHPEQTLVLRLEDYSKDRHATINKVYTHIGLDILDDSYKQKLQNMNVKNGKKRVGRLPMLNSTKELLGGFYAYFNKRLATMLNDDRFLWKDQ